MSADDSCNGSALKSGKSQLPTRPLKNYCRAEQSAVTERMEFPAAPTPTGFTLVELLVVIAIIGILVAPTAARNSGGTRIGTPSSMPEPAQADRLGDA